jgi:hypothetical protein
LTIAAARWLRPASTQVLHNDREQPCRLRTPDFDIPIEGHPHVASKTARLIVLAVHLACISCLVTGSAFAQDDPLITAAAPQPLFSTAAHGRAETRHEPVLTAEERTSETLRLGGARRLPTVDFEADTVRSASAATECELEGLFESKPGLESTVNDPDHAVDGGSAQVHGPPEHPAATRIIPRRRFW